MAELRAPRRARRVGRRRHQPQGRGCGGRRRTQRNRLSVAARSRRRRPVRAAAAPRRLDRPPPARPGGGIVIHPHRFDGPGRRRHRGRRSVRNCDRRPAVQRRCERRRRRPRRRRRQPGRRDVRRRRRAVPARRHRARHRRGRDGVRRAALRRARRPRQQRRADPPDRSPRGAARPSSTARSTSSSTSTSRARSCARSTRSPALRRSGGGAIVNISSVAAIAHRPGNTVYSASKAAVIGVHPQPRARAGAHDPGERGAARGRRHAVHGRRLRRTHCPPRRPRPMRAGLPLGSAVRTGRRRRRRGATSHPVTPRSSRAPAFPSTAVAALATAA